MRPLEFNHDARSTNRQRGTDAQNSFPPRGPLNVFSTGRRLLPSPVPVISRNESKRTPIISISISASGGRPGSRHSSAAPLVRRGIRPLHFHHRSRSPLGLQTQHQASASPRELASS